MDSIRGLKYGLFPQMRKWQKAQDSNKISRGGGESNL